MTRAYVHTILPSLFSSLKLASTGEIIGTVQQDRATAIAGTLGAGPDAHPDQSEADVGSRHQENVQDVRSSTTSCSRRCSPTCRFSTRSASYERQNGAASYAVRGSATVKKYGNVDFEDLFTGDHLRSARRPTSSVPINFLLRNAFEDVDIEGLSLEIDASEQSRSRNARARVDRRQPAEAGHRPSR